MTEKNRRETPDLKRSIWRIIPICLIPVFITTMVISIIALCRPDIEQKEFDELAEMVYLAETEKIEVPQPEPKEEVVIPPETISAEPHHTECRPTEPAMLERYRAIYEMNPDMFGWIFVEGTSVNYPVMHTPDEPERYLRKNFEGDYSGSGVPFMAAECFEGCGNYILYGHNMKNGSMFHDILSYQDEDFLGEHPVIRFDTMYSTGEYEVYAVFYSRAYYTDETGVFRVYDYADLSDEEAFQSFAEQAKAASLYDTHVEAAYGDQFITLITCSYHVQNGRFVVVAVQHQKRGCFCISCDNLH